ncbi:hypothetical protein ALP75_204719 [Pseudomonas syringae pv. actinidiae]|nr:hypothetical protein ALP75_204719 [Pseudomonas syringae pv. actinidiae]
MLSLIAQYPALPTVVEVVPAQAQGVEPGHVAIAQRRQRRILQERFVSRQCLLQPLFDALRRNGRRRVDTPPAHTRLPVFDPGVGIELTHRQVLPVRVQFAALIPGHHPRRNACGTQHKGHGPGIVRAEAPATDEQKLVNAVVTQRRRLEGVMKRLVAEIAEHGLDQRVRLRIATAQVGGPLASLIIAFGGQLQVLPLNLLAGLRVAKALRPGVDGIQQRLLDGPSALQAKVAHLAHVRQCSLRHVEARHPRSAAGFHDDAVSQRRAALFPLRHLHGLRACRLRPATSVELLKGQAAPVQLIARRHRPFETGTKHQRGGFAQLGHVARCHVVGQPRDALVARLRQGPERVQARKKQEQQQHQRHGLGHQLEGQLERVS